MIEPEHPRISTARQCQLLGLPRSTYYHQPKPTPADDLALMCTIDQVYLAHPEFGSRHMTRWLRRQGYQINRKRVRRLMRLMCLEIGTGSGRNMLTRIAGSVRGHQKPATCGRFKTSHILARNPHFFSNQLQAMRLIWSWLEKKCCSHLHVLMWYGFW